MRAELAAAGRVDLAKPPHALDWPAQRDTWSCGYANLGALLRSALGLTFSASIFLKVKYVGLF